MRSAVLLTLFILMAALGVALLPAARPAAANPLTGVVAISAGGAHTCELTEPGGVKCWGNNMEGELGDGTLTDRSVPVDVVGLGSGVAAIAAGGGLAPGLTCALTTAGGVKCWGWDRMGQLGVPPERVEACPERLPKPEPTSGSASDPKAGAASGSSPCSTTPADVTGLRSGVTAIAAGVYHACALTEAGGVKCWGWNALGVLGDGTLAAHSTPVNVCQVYDNSASQCTEPLSGITAIAAGYEHTCAVTSAGSVKCWGANDAGQLGAEGSDTCPDPFTGIERPCSLTPLDVEGLPGEAVAITASGVHTCALTTTSQVECWGGGHALGDAGRCGSRCITPVDVCADTTCTSPLSGVVAIDAGRFDHTCAVTANRGVKCWGGNDWGGLGDGTTTDRTTPVDVCQTYDEAAEHCVKALSGVTALSAGAFFTCALTEDGSLKCWGDNCCGQLGRGGGTYDLDPHPLPADVVALGVKSSPGDVDCSQHVDALDATLILQFHAGLLSSLPCAGSADVNIDGSIDSIDALFILQYSAGLICLSGDVVCIT